jgi:hypothetical protein
MENLERCVSGVQSGEGGQTRRMRRGGGLVLVGTRSVDTI